jgi:hypothetical protein
MTNDEHGAGSASGAAERVGPARRDPLGLPELARCALVLPRDATDFKRVDPFRPLVGLYAAGSVRGFTS